MRGLTARVMDECLVSTYLSIAMAELMISHGHVPRFTCPYTMISLRYMTKSIP